MREIRNSDGRLVCRIDEAAGIIEIYIKGCLTRIQWMPEGKVRTTHVRQKTLST